MIREEKLNFNTITRPFKQIDSNYLYMDKQFESKGINYKKFISKNNCIFRTFILYQHRNARAICSYYSVNR